MMTSGSIGYETKFASFIQLCRNAEEDGTEVVLIAAPAVLGDTYQEIIESLNRLADAGLKLAIASRRG